MPWDRARTLKWLVLSVGVTVGATLLLWHFLGVGAFFGFLFLPFLPILLRRGDGASAAVGVERVCPRCAYVARDRSERYCPRDAAPLV